MRKTTTLLLVLLFSPLPGEAKDDRKDVRAAVNRSVAWLDRHLGNLTESRGTPQKQFTYGLAGLVFLMAGQPVEDIKDYLVDWVDEVARRSRDPEELPDRHGSFSSKRLVQYSWPLAQAGLFFSELYLRGRYRPEAKRVLLLIRDLLQEAQDANGGWGHGRVRSARSFGYPSTLVASTNCVAATMGVIEATLGRGTVEGLDAARRYYHAARLDNGSYPYDPSQRSAHRDQTGVARAGGALMAMHFLGVSSTDPDFAESRALVMNRLDYTSEGHGSSMLSLAHTALGLKATSGKAFARFRDLYFPRILGAQSEDGDLTCVCERKAFATTCDKPREGLPPLLTPGKQAYVTSLLTFVLLLDEGRLEILKKKLVKARPRGEATESPRGRRRK